MPDGHSNSPSVHGGGYNDGIVDASGYGEHDNMPPIGGEGPNPRKRARKEASKPEDGGDKKRGRGRPRLNANDETAAERRRTQIRLAQRAYRNRKETTISSLEQQVRDLVDTNDEMSNAFAALQEFAASRGLFEQVPELGAQLQSAAEKFQALSQKSSNPGHHDDGSRGRPGSGSSSPDALFASPQQPASRKDEYTYSGTDVVRDAITQHGLATPLPYRSSPERHSPGMQRRQQTVTAPENPVDASGLEVITQPTYENASFPVQFTDDELNALLAHNPSPLGTAPSPPRTYSPAENTFGRRLQRFALECGLKLISLPNPPPLPLVRVFGFCLPFESPDMIRDRLQRSLLRQDRESLNFWEFPFHNLGGAGTHFQPMPGTLVGNQGTVDLMRNSIGGGFPIGPPTVTVAESGQRLDKKQRISVPGYEGDFYDAEEVEIYLRQKGVHILPRQDVITAEIDFSVFEDKKSTTQQPQPRQQPPQQQYQQPQQQYQQPQAAYGLPQPSAGIYPGVFMGMPEVPNMGHFLPTHSVVEEHVQGLPVLAQQSPVLVGHMNPGMVVSPTGSHETVSGSTGYILPDQYPTPANMRAPISYTTGTYQDPNIPPFTAQMPQFHTSRPSRTMISLDVNMFIKKLTETTTCLGRSPGFRLENVHKAFMAAIMR
ncbi:hypothetical protein MCOR02_009287 [Pyricularia oryzae]|nr:hypothetical protein MCOR02_009287 [Pyricularia oryzae]KAI6306356.1 hypothetical protein MCOR34_008092 [Pyricularia oryzae]KAI6478510.1 hypothetical protein MCOR17_000096 [Pyricularia oryzae]KAI6498339.1 hypothetical protein MCOR13_006543 [Pyricularia oryzae]KAI6604550.1 hypothetical protein MCOR04_001433 [Pyricularia oryzae]